MTEKQETVLAAMKKAGIPMKPGEIAEATGIDQKEVAKIIDDLKKEGKVVFAQAVLLGAVQIDGAHERTDASDRGRYH